LYQEFLDFLANKEYSYTTSTEQQLDALEETAKKEEYLERIRPEFEALLAKKEDMKSQDLMHFKKEISKFLRLEIVSRYYYRRGRIASDIKDDEEVLQALEVLNSSTKYDSILSSSFNIPVANMSEEEEELSGESPEVGDEE
jgi:carboxyl-terminal processing protease